MLQKRIESLQKDFKERIQNPILFDGASWKAPKLRKKLNLNTTREPQAQTEPEHEITNIPVFKRNNDPDGRSSLSSGFQGRIKY
jgi:hypothetical protein